MSLSKSRKLFSECEENSLVALVELRFCLGNIGRRVGQDTDGLTRVADHG
jgi:hypothetical protein